MTRLLKLATIILSIVSFASAQTVDTLNTPAGPITDGANVQVSWTLLPGANAAGKTGVLTAVDTSTKNTITIDSAVQLAPMTYTWAVNVTPSTYTLGLNDGSGQKQSGPVTIVAAAPSAPSAPGNGTSTSASAPVPTAPAPSTPAASTPGASNPAASTPAASNPAASTPAASNPATPKTPTTSTTGSSTTSTTTGSSAKSTSSASSIFSGYDVIFSLLGVAIAMIQF